MNFFLPIQVPNTSRASRRHAELWKDTHAYKVIFGRYCKHVHLRHLKSCMHAPSPIHYSSWPRFQLHSWHQLLRTWETWILMIWAWGWTCSSVRCSLEWKDTNHQWSLPVLRYFGHLLMLRMNHSVYDVNHAFSQLITLSFIERIVWNSSQWALG